MKKSVKTLIILCAFLMVFSFFGCDVKLSGGPNKTDPISSNGSLVVRKGDYLYFVNGYVSNSSLSNKDNNYGNVKNAGIYRAKLENGKLIYVTETDEEGNETKKLTNVELLVPKVAGFEYGALYIFGDYLYFSTPNTEKDKTGKIRFDLTDFYCVALNGGKIYRLDNAVNISDLNNFTFSTLNNKVYLTYFDGTNIYNLRINGNKVENKAKIASNVSSFSLVTNNSVYNNEISDVYNYVYYTRSFKEDENSVTGNVLAKASLLTNQETVLVRDNVNAFSVKAVKNENIYYSRTNSYQTNEYIYSNALENFNLESEKQLTIVNYSSNQYILDVMDGYPKGVIVNENNKLMLLTGINNPETDITVLYDGEFSVMLIKGEYIYGQDANKNLIRVNFQTKQIQTILNSDLTLETSQIDYDNGYLYYLVKYTNDNGDSYYLTRYYLNSNAEETSEFIGVFNEEDIPSVEEDVEE